MAGRWHLTATLRGHSRWDLPISRPTHAPHALRPTAGKEVSSLQGRFGGVLEQWSSSLLLRHRVPGFIVRNAGARVRRAIR